MGSMFPCCVQVENAANYEKNVDMSVIAMFPKINFVFTKNHAEKVQISDCVIVNASKKHTQNQFYFKHISQKDREKVKELITTDQHGTVEVINNPVQSLHTNDIIIVHLPVWGQPDAQQDLTKAYNKAFDQAVKRNHKIIIITEVEQQMGIPINCIYKVLHSCIEKHQNSIEKIIFNMEDQSKLNYFNNQLTGQKGQNRKSVPESDLSK